MKLQFSFIWNFQQKEMLFSRISDKLLGQLLTEKEKQDKWLWIAFEIP